MYIHYLVQSHRSDIYPAFFAYFAFYITQFMLYNIKITIAYVVEKQYLCSEIINHLIIAIMKEKTTKKLTIFVSTEEFNVCVAAFKALLSRRGILQHYYIQWNTINWVPIDASVESVWEKWASNRLAQDWISTAFTWSNSNIPSSVWRALHMEWNEWLDANLNF